jgi:hypothetical protein
LRGSMRRRSWGWRISRGLWRRKTHVAKNS